MLKINSNRDKSYNDKDESYCTILEVSHITCVCLVTGGDDRRVLLWRVEQAIQGMGKPVVMKAQHASNIFCLGYDSSKTKIFSAGNDDQVIVHNLQT